ncbi:hypothetical protein [Arthrobacter sp. CG_A4]|uniref:hypothetical protein n=1 Tax=Arthrobacter sp. CG_A4 TaxID=3071706 RepID=UPI002E01E412|nr:hypothetical protein [Arthrobacter sp. CG_A4]
MTARGELNTPGALDAIRDLERALSDRVKHRAFAAESSQVARREADDLLAEARERGARAAERTRQDVRLATEIETASILAGADDEIAAIHLRVTTMRAELLAGMRAVALPEAHDPKEA